MADHFLNEHGGNIYAYMRACGQAEGSLLDYSANINPLGLSDRVRQAITNSIEQVIHYPDIEAAMLKQAICDAYSVKYETITPANGAVEMLYILCHLLRPRSVLITAPAFSEYERASRAAQARIDYCTLIEEDGFRIPIEQVIEQIPGSDLLFIGNPNNPTGTLLKQQQIEQLLAVAACHNAFVVVDESFLDFVPDDASFTSRPLLSKYPNLIIIHSLTKFYAIPGLRLGFALASASLTQKMHQSKDPWNVNMLAQNAGVAALKDETYRTASRDLVNQEKHRLYQALCELPGIKAYPPSVNFILADITATGFSAGQFRQAMLEHGILIRDCSNYPGLSGGFIRLAVKLPQQNNRLLETLRTLLGVSL